MLRRDLKIRTFNLYIASVFLHDSEFWAVTKTLEDNIDAFQRRLLRSEMARGGSILWGTLAQDHWQEGEDFFPNRIRGQSLFFTTEKGVKT